MPNKWNSFQAAIKSFKLSMSSVRALYKTFSGDSVKAINSLTQIPVKIRQKKIKVVIKPRRDYVKEEYQEMTQRFLGLKEDIKTMFMPEYITLSQVMEIILENYVQGKFYLLEIEGINYTLNDRNLAQLESLLYNDDVIIAYTNSDADFVLRLSNAHWMNITLLGDTRKRKHEESGFFPYWNTTDKDLIKYQIFKKTDKYQELSVDNCFVYTLQQSKQFTDIEMSEIKLFIQTRDLSVRKINQICQRFNFSVNLKRRRPDGKLDVRKLNGQKSRHIHIGVIHNHYFLNENRSFELIENIELLHGFEPIGVRETVEMTREYYKNEDMSVPSLEIRVSGDSVNCRPFELKTKNVMRTHIWVADFESYQDSKTSDATMKCSLRPLLLVSKRSMYMNEYGDVEKVQDTLRVMQKLQKSDMKDWLRDITSKCKKYQVIGTDGKPSTVTEKAVVYFHNLKYDFVQMLDLMDDEIRVKSVLPHGGSMLSAKVIYDGKTIEFRCSYRLTTMSIKDLAKSFLGKEQQKEMCPYSLYTEETLHMESVPVKVLEEFYQGDVLLEFRELAKEFIHNGQFFLHSFNEFYCIRDVEILDECLFKFQQLIHGEFQMPVNALSFLTCASLADYYVSYQGAYDGVYELCGMPQLFCSQAVVGGRTMTNSNKAWKVQEEIADEDINSLYPAAMSQIEIPIDMPIEINGDYPLSTVPYYIVEIEVLDITHEREFPLLSSKDKKGVRIFSNDVRGKVILDKVSLEDAVEFQGMKYRLIRGYVWTKTNPKIQTIIRYIYDKRVELKKAGDQREVLYKLIMNSSYGKNLLKPFEKKSCIVDKQDFGTKIINSYQNISKVCNLPNDKYLIEEFNQTLEQFNRVHVGCQILSQSKRIMNKIMCLADDCGIKIYYQDTDSMHLGIKDRSTLENKYREKYGHGLYHKSELGKLSSDFKVEDQDGKVFKDGIGVEGYYLGKKQYAVRVQNSKGQVGYHMRQKGIPSSFMSYGDYEEMYQGKQIIKKLIDPENPKSVAGIRLTNLKANILKSFHRTIRCNQEIISDIV
jgi:hypothetical protein